MTATGRRLKLGLMLYKKIKDDVLVCCESGNGLVCEAVKNVAEQWPLKPGG